MNMKKLILWREEVDPVYMDSRDTVFADLSTLRGIWITIQTEPAQCSLQSVNWLYDYVAFP